MATPRKPPEEHLPPGPPSGLELLSDARFGQIVWAIKDGASPYEIALRFDTSAASVRRWLKAPGHRGAVLRQALADWIRDRRHEARAGGKGSAAAQWELDRRVQRVYGRRPPPQRHDVHHAGTIQHEISADAVLAEIRALRDARGGGPRGGPDDG